MTNLDETKLARLEALADNYFKCVSLPFEESAYRELAIHYCPALIAEVRRLRQKVEAWEWWAECRETFRNHFVRNNVRVCALEEMTQTLTAAREAVHADRE